MIDAISDKILKSMYETIPVEITIIDENDIVVGWNKHNDRIFYRPEVSMGMNFRECHPQKSLELVEKIVNEMKSGVRDKARFWADVTVDKEKSIKHKVLIEFFALRDAGRKYIGCMECSQDIEDIMHLEGERRLIDGE